MKLLVITKPKDTLSALPPAITRQLLEVTVAAIRQQKKEGKILESYYSPAGCSVVILDYKEAEEWIQDQASVPILSYYHQEVYPIADMETSMQSLVEGLKKAESIMASK